MSEANLFPRQQTLLGATSAPVSLYVATTGDDDTGEGTALNPYATVERAYADLPKTLKHECKILVEAGNYASGWPKSIAPIIEDDGSLAIVGVGVPAVVSGPWTVTGVADLGTGGQRVTVGAGGLGAVDSLCGQWVMVATGGHPGNVHQVVANTDTTIDLIKVTDGPHNADTFNLVNPAVKIATEGFSIVYAAHTACEMDGSFVVRSSRLAMHNLYLDASAATLWAPISMQGRQGDTGSYWSLVRIDAPAGTYNAVELTNFVLPQVARPLSDDYITDGATGVTNLGDGCQLSIAGGIARNTRAVYSYGRCALWGLVSEGAIYLAGETSGGYCAFGGLEAYALNFDFVNLVIVGTAGEQAIVICGGYAYLAYVHVLLGTNALYLKNAARASLRSVSCDATGITVGAALLEAACTLTMKGALTGFVGASAGGDKAYKFVVDAGAVKSDTWPAANYGSDTDTKGGVIVRID